MDSQVDLISRARHELGFAPRSTWQKVSGGASPGTGRNVGHRT